MKRFVPFTLLALFVCLVAAGTASTTPSTTYWTPATSDVQPFNVWHIGVDNYFRLYQTQEDRDKMQGAALPTDVGLTVGVLPFEKLNLEAGIDYLGPATFAQDRLRSMGSSILEHGELLQADLGAELQRMLAANPDQVFVDDIAVLLLDRWQKA